LSLLRLFSKLSHFQIKVLMRKKTKSHVVKSAQRKRNLCSFALSKNCVKSCIHLPKTNLLKKLCW
jgi:hypothetical protein